MKHYDLRVIEDCLVYSYEVEPPKNPVSAVASTKTKAPLCRKKKKQMFGFQKLFLKLFLILLMPFALLIDAGVAFARYTANAFSFVLKSSRKYAPALSTLSCLILASALFSYI